MPLERARRRGKTFCNPIPTTVGGLGMLPKVLWEYLTDRAERTPRRRLGPFVTDPAAYRSAPTSGLRVTWFGHSSSLVEIDGARILLDPLWDERAAPVQWAGPRRFFSPTLPLDRLPRLDAIVLSHDHYDHLGEGTVRQLAAAANIGEPRWLCPLGLKLILVRWGVPAGRITQLDWTESAEVGAVEVTALPARHFSGRGLHNRNRTLWASFALFGSAHRVFYGADSGEWEGFAEIGHRYGPFDLTMLEIGASNPLWADIHMGPIGAARTFTAMTAAQVTQSAPRGLLMPIHWGLFDLALHAWREPIETLSAIPGLRLWSPEPGRPTEVRPDEELRSAWWQI